MEPDQETSPAASHQQGAVGDDSGEREPLRVRLPGFVSDKDVGLGDVIKRMTRSAGIKTCSGCERRASALNRWVVFSGGPHR